ncbi:MAG: alanine racemase [Deltaproteobacteria bacterium]|nr:MAG: alanine racemase [Deltaproteobacteria bacterium]
MRRRGPYNAGVTKCAAIRPTRVVVDLSAIVANAAAVAAHAGVDLYAVVKADAYGHGAVPVARALERAPGVAGLAVSLVEEGVELRDAGVAAPVLVMGPSLGGAHAEVVARGLTPVVSDPADLERFAAVGRARGAPVAVHVKLDTGMHRLGIAPEAAVGACAPRDGLVVEGICTHLASADADDPADPDSPTRRQLARFDAALAALTAAGRRPPIAHAANSAGALRFAARYDRVRPGLALYGAAAGPVSLAPALEFASAIAQVRDVPAGGRVSYGGLWTATRPTRAAVVPVGYADGYPRNLTGRADVLVAGRRCPVIGAVSMDMILVDVTDLGDAVAVGQPVILIGSDGRERISVVEFAAGAGISAYEVTCGISKRVPRTYRGGGADA